MTQPTQQQRIDRLAIEFMGWERDRIGQMNVPGEHRHWWLKGAARGMDPPIAKKDWNPFESHDDAHLLLLECERRGLLEKWVVELEAAGHSNVLFTAEQQTEAVEAAAGLGEKT